jgi:hypothetical protein
VLLCSALLFSVFVSQVLVRNVLDFMLYTRLVLFLFCLVSDFWVTPGSVTTTGFTKVDDIQPAQSKTAVQNGTGKRKKEKKQMALETVDWATPRKQLQVASRV